MTPGITYRWAARSVIAHINAGTPEILLYGARGTSKTVILCDILHRSQMQFPGMVQLWTRSARTLLTDAALKTFETEILPMWPGNSFGGKSRESRNSYHYPNTSQTILQGLDDPQRQRSVGADTAWVNEPTEITESQWEEIGGSLRERMGMAQVPSVLLGDINPAPPSHWTNTRCEPFPTRLYPRVPRVEDMRDSLTPAMYQEIQEYNLAPLCAPYKTKKIVFTFADNPGYWDTDAWDWWPGGLKYARDRLGPQTGSRRARYLEGRPVAEEGVVFDDFDRDRHVIPRFEIPSGVDGWPVWCAYDPGYRHPCAVDFVAIAPNGQPFFVDEIHAPLIRIEDLGPRIVEMARKYNVVRWLDDPRGANQATQVANGITARDFMRRFGLHFHPWKASEGPAKQAQVEALREWLNRDKPLQIFEDCHGIISNFETWKNKMNRAGELVEGDERYEDRNNDGIDGLMGIVADKPVYDEHKVRVYSNPV